MTEVKLYKVIIASLLLLNISMLAFFFFHRPPHPHNVGNGGSRNNFLPEVFKILDLNNQQQIDFKTLSLVHHKQMNRWDSMQVALLPIYFDQLIETESNTALREEILNKISSIERQKVEFTYQHFEEVKDLLQPNQSKYYNDFVKKATKKIYNNRIPEKK